MAGRIDNIDYIVLVFPDPLRFGGSGGNGDPALLFLCHPVHGSGAIVYFANFMADTRVVQYALGGGGFTGVNVCSDTNISGEPKIF